MTSLISKEFCVKSILIFRIFKSNLNFNEIVHNTSDIVLNFLVKKPKINLFMNEKPQSLIIVINCIKLNETFWKKIWSCMIQIYWKFEDNRMIIFEIMEK